MATPEITVIIPTVASGGRAAGLFRAIESVQSQDANCTVVAVVNGPARDGKVVSGLTSLDRVRVLDMAEGDLVKALVFGVQEVRTEFYCILDDDDLLLPGALRRRLALMERAPGTDAVVTPGEKHFSDGRVEPIPKAFDGSDPLYSLLQDQWLASCGGFYRRSTIGPEFFAGMPRFLEWTYLAFRLLRERRVAFFVEGEDAHYRVFQTSGSESARTEYVLSMPANLRRLSDPFLPRRTARLLSEKIGRACHAASMRCSRNDMIWDALRFHLASLRESRGLRYLPYTRHLVLDALGAHRRQRAG